MANQKDFTEVKVKSVQVVSRVPPPALRNLLIEESRGQCAICGSRNYLQIARIGSFVGKGTTTTKNYVVLCPTCHAMIDRGGFPESLLYKIKSIWIQNGELGRIRILEFSGTVTNASTKIDSVGSGVPLLAEALARYNGFDAAIDKLLKDLKTLPSEDVFLNKTLRFLFEGLGFKGVTVLHHTGQLERGKDMVFYDNDRLAGITYYGVVAAKGKIHAQSSKVSDSGHYLKILDQVHKSFQYPYPDVNLKAEFFLDKVVVACSEAISEEAVGYFQKWEQKHGKRLLYLTGPDIAARLLTQQLKQSQ